MKKMNFKWLVVLCMTMGFVNVAKAQKDFTIAVKGVSFTMKYIEGGSFLMGATPEQGNNIQEDEEPVHSVTLSSFYIGETEVTQALWKAVMEGNPSEFIGDNLPVENVSWNDCQEFIHKLNRLTGKNFRLPTEAEWEYAARGGKMSEKYKYSGSDELKDVAWYGDNSGYDLEWEMFTGEEIGSTKEAKTKTANELGLFDMSGNVSEWCNDWTSSYSKAQQTNPKGLASGNARVIRGGCWSSSACNCRISNRDSAIPDYRKNFVGFRLALSK